MDVDPAVTFAWNGVVDAEMFELQLSTVAPGANDQYDSGELPNITSLAHIDLLPNTGELHPVWQFKVSLAKPQHNLLCPADHEKARNGILC